MPLRCASVAGVGKEDGAETNNLRLITLDSRSAHMRTAPLSGQSRADNRRNRRPTVPILILVPWRRQTTFGSADSRRGGRVRPYVCKIAAKYSTEKEI